MFHRFAALAASLTLGALATWGLLLAFSPAPRVSAQPALDFDATPTPATQIINNNIIAVNSLADVVANDNQCTLREAIIAANTNQASGTQPNECVAGQSDDLIEMGNLQGTILLSSTLPTIVSNLVVNGSGADNLTLDGGGSVRVLKIANGAVNISNLTIAHGYIGPEEGQGGGLFNSSPDAVYLSGVKFLDNRAKGTDGYSTCEAPPPPPPCCFGGGGAIYHRNGTLTLMNSALISNTAQGGRGGVYGFSVGSGGGGGAFGGGLFVANGTVNIIATQFLSNQAVGGEGGPRGPSGSSGCSGPTGGGQYQGLGGGGAGGWSGSPGSNGLFGGGGGGAGWGSSGGLGGFGGGNGEPATWNHGAGGGGAGMGGGLFNLGGVVNISYSSFYSNNRVIGGDGPNNAQDGQGIASAIFNSATLNLANTGLPLPTLSISIPATNIHNVPVTQTFGWHISGYESVFYSQGSAHLSATMALGTSPTNLITVANTISTFVPPMPLAPLTTYYWMVTATTAYHFVPSALMSFTTAPGPVAAFGASPRSGPYPLAVMFTNTSLNATRYLWSFGDGYTSSFSFPSHTYAASGSYTVSLQASGLGGNHWLTATNFIGVYAAPAPLANFQTNILTGVAPLTVTFQNASQNATSFLWNFGDGGTSTAISPTYVYTNSGVYTVALRASNPTGADILTRTAYITVYPRARANFSGAPIAGLAPLGVAFTNTSLVATQFVWNYGDGLTGTTTSATHTHMYAAPGVYTVALTAIGPYNSETYTRAAYITVYDLPIASFVGAPRQGIAPLLVNFSNSSLNATSYVWNFGDGSQNTSAQPSHLYAGTGFYTVTLTASNPFASDTLIRPAYIAVFQGPTPSFFAAVTAGLQPFTVTFTNASLNANAYLWDYGDGLTNTVATPTHTHTYQTAGVFTVRLTAFNMYGNQTLTRTTYISVYRPATANFTATPVSGIAPLSVTFANLSQDATNFLWVFGDGTTAVQTSPMMTITHLYPAGGVYTVALQATNSVNSQWLTRTNYIAAHQGPLPSFTSTARMGPGPLAVAFTNTSQFADTYIWAYGDGVTSTLANGAHVYTYTTPGLYTVTLTAINAYSTTLYTRPYYVVVEKVITTPVYYVDAELGSNLPSHGSRQAPWKTISYALSQLSGSGLEIHVAPGLYTPALGENIPITMKPGISLIGAEAAATTLAGNVNQSSRVVYFASSTAFVSTTVLSGFKITSGVQGVEVEGVPGVGSAPTIQANWITGNAIGIAIESTNGGLAKPVIQQNRIVSNTSHGIYNHAAYGGAIVAPIIDNNVLSYNGGAGSYCYAAGSGYPYQGMYGFCDPVLTRNSLTYNTGDGFTCSTVYCGGCRQVMDRNLIANNGGWGLGRNHDGTYLAPTTPKLTNNFIVNNAQGGALFISPVSVYGDRDAPVFINNTIAYNNTYGVMHGYPTIINSIVWGHISDLNIQTVSDVSYSNVSQGPYAGNNYNLSANPLFIDPQSGNYHIRVGSPVVNRGNNNAPGLPTTDFDGDARILGQVVDMGADERVSWIEYRLYLPVVLTP